MNLNAPIIARLNPAEPAMPPDFTPLRVKISRGVPQRLDIAPAGLRLVLNVASGLVRPLMTLPPDSVVLTSADPSAGEPGNISAMLGESRARPAPRLLCIADGHYVAACPLLPGARMLLPGTSGHASAVAEIYVLSFTLTVAALVGRGGGATESWVELGWRELRATDSFDSAVLRADLRTDLRYTSVRDGKAQQHDAGTDLLSPDAQTTMAAGGLDWRLLHDRL